MEPCKHLDHREDQYGPNIDLVEIEGFSCPVFHFVRHDYKPGGPLHYENAPVCVQYCGQGRGRINEIFACYNPGEMACHSAHEKEKK